jgi:hypothetical protein
MRYILINFLSQASTKFLREVLTTKTLPFPSKICGLSVVAMCFRSQQSLGEFSCIGGPRKILTVPCIMATQIPLVKGSHMAKPKICGVGSLVDPWKGLEKMIIC